MADPELHAHITALAEEEHALLGSRTGGGLDPVQHARLAEIEVELDRSWDLLRQRDARRRAGQDPDTATERSGSTVEGYLN